MLIGETEGLGLAEINPVKLLLEIPNLGFKVLILGE
jgi:hypothetical protein